MRTWKTAYCASALLATLFLPSPLDAQEAKELEIVQRLLAVPTSLARVTEAYWPEALHDRVTDIPLRGPDFVMLQDVHRHPQVQEQLAAVILHGYHHWGVKKVFLEGAFTPVDMSVFHRLPPDTRNELLARLVRDGDLSGPELAAVMIMEKEWRNPPTSPFQLLGLDDPKLYRRHFSAYQQVQETRGDALEELASIRRLQESMRLPEPNVLSAQLARTENLVRLKLTPSEYDAYHKAKEAIPPTRRLEPAIRAAEQYYQSAHLRSRFFVQQAQRIAPACSNTRVIIVGGFHTASMGEDFRLAGRTYVIFSPAVSPSDVHTLYEKRLRQTVHFLAEELASFP